MRAAATVARVGTTAGDPNENGASANAGTGPTDAVTLLPEKTVLAILRDRRATRRAAQFRETAARRSFVAAERLAKRGEYADALPLALDAVRRGQDIHSTPRARTAAADAASEKASAPARDAADGTSAPHVALFEPYLLAATIALALGKTDACENLVGLASWIALRRGDAVSETEWQPRFAHGTTYPISAGKSSRKNICDIACAHVHLVLAAAVVCLAANSQGEL